MDATPTSSVTPAADPRETAVWSPHHPMIRASSIAALAAVLLLTTACSSDEPDPPRGTSSAPTSGSPSEPPVEEIATRATIRTVTGSMPARARTQLRGKITATVDDWFEAAYLGGDYPRTDFDNAFEAFTAGAQERATSDRQLMSNAAVGTTTFGVRALARRVMIDVLAVDGRASGVTVDFRLGMARAGDTGAERRERVAGHLYLTHSPGDGWQVFGYDVQRGEIA